MQRGMKLVSVCKVSTSNRRPGAHLRAQKSTRSLFGPRLHDQGPLGSFRKASNSKVTSLRATLRASHRKSTFWEHNVGPNHLDHVGLLCGRVPLCHWPVQQVLARCGILNFQAESVLKVAARGECPLPIAPTSTSRYSKMQWRSAAHLLPLSHNLGCPDVLACLKLLGVLLS